MAGATVRYRLRDGELEVVGHGPIEHEGGETEFQATLDLVGRASLTSLRNAFLRVSADYHGRTVSLALVAAPQHLYDSTYDGIEFLPEPTSIAVYGEPKQYDAYRAPGASRDVAVVRRGDQPPENASLTGVLVVRVTTEMEQDAEPTLEAVAPVLAPLLARHRAELVTLEAQLAFPTMWSIWIDARYPVRGNTVQDAYEFGQDLHALISAAQGGRLTRETALDLILAGRAGLLIGVPESEWLDGKEAPYQPTDWDRFELAKDVAGFANAPSGGLIVIGAKTKKQHGSDVIAGVRPFDPTLATPSSLRQVIDARVFPPPEGLQIERIDAGGGKALVVISVPPQPEAMKPFLVGGAIIGNKIVGSHVSIFVRRGEGTPPVSPAQLHSLLVLGRATALGLETRQSDPEG